MTIVERVNAAVDFKFQQSDGTASVKEIEDYLFAARMRGAEDESRLKFTVKEGYPYDNRSYTNGVSIPVAATMGGFPLAPVAKKGMTTRRKAQLIATGSVVALLGILGTIISLLFVML